MEITKRQMACLEAINNITKGQGFPPTLNEICCYVQVSSRSTAHKHVSLLAEKGLVTWTEGMQRTIRLTEQGRKLLEVAA